MNKYKVVALYLRKSREDESLEETLARHERMLIDYCKRNNLIIKDVFKEVVTGENLEVRPKARQMLENVSAGMYEGVVVVELERLSRGNVVDQVEITETFKNSKTKIYTLNKVYDLSAEDSFDEDFFEFGLFFSRREYKTIKRRMQRGKLQAQKEGYYTGSHLPYGFNKVRGDRGCILVPNEDSKVVQLVFNKYVHEDYTISQLAEYLNSNKIKPAKSEAWEKVGIRKLLKNKVYLGYVYVGSSKNRTNAKVYDGKHEAIIDEDTFNKAQEKLLISTPRTKFGRGLTNPLASLVYCSSCGYAMVKTAEYIKCIRYGCKTSSAYMEVVEKKIIEELKNELANLNVFLDNYSEEIKLKNKLQEDEIKLLNKEISKRNKMIDKACEMLELGVYSKEKYIGRVSLLESELNVLKSNLEALKNSLVICEDKKIRKAIPIFEKVLDEYWSFDVKQKNDILKSIIDRIEYTKTIRNNRWNNSSDDLDLKIFLKI
jgi:DNA invertase Pin-like site-specific DNA recombinase